MSMKGISYQPYLKSSDSDEIISSETEETVPFLKKKLKETQKKLAESQGEIQRLEYVVDALANGRVKRYRLPGLPLKADPAKTNLVNDFSSVTTPQYSQAKESMRIPLLAKGPKSLISTQQECQALRNKQAPLQVAAKENKPKRWGFF